MYQIILKTNLMEIVQTVQLITVIRIRLDFSLSSNWLLQYMPNKKYKKSKLILSNFSILLNTKLGKHVIQKIIKIIVLLFIMIEKRVKGSDVHSVNSNLPEFLINHFMVRKFDYLCRCYYQ